MVSKIRKKYKMLPIQVKASFWFLICSFFQKGISTITTPIFTRLLTAAEYGQYSVFNSWMDIISIFVTLRMYYGVYSQGLVKFDKETKEFSSSLQGLTLTLVLCWLVIYLSCRDFCNEIFSLSTIQMLSMFVIIWMTAVFEFWATEQKVNFRYGKLVIITIVVSLAKPLAGIFLVIHSNDKVTARIVGLAVVSLIAFLWMFFAQMQRGRKFFSKKFWKYALKFNIPLVPHYLSLTLLNSSDRIMIEKFVSSDTAGIYSLAYSISLIMTLFNQAMMQTISPWIYQKIKAKKTEDIAPVAYATLFIVAMANLILILFAPEAVRIFAPSEYYDAIWVIPPIAMSVFFMYCYDLFAKFEFYYEKTNFIMFASVGGAILNIILNYIFIPIFGYYAAGYTTLVCYSLFALGHYYFMKRVCQMHMEAIVVYDVKILLSIVFGFVGSGFLFLFTYRIAFLRYLIVILIGITAIMKHKNMVAVVKNILKIRNN